MDYNLTTHFYLKNGKENVIGQSPVYLRITLNGQRTEISTNQSILSDNWNKRTERAKGNREEVRIFNGYLDSIYADDLQHETLINVTFCFELQSSEGIKNFSMVY